MVVLNIFDAQKESTREISSQTPISLAKYEDLLVFFDPAGLLGPRKEKRCAGMPKFTTFFR